MAISKKSRLEMGGAVGALALLALGGVAACGSDFSGEDCRVSRTCVLAAGAGQSAGAEAGAPSADPNADAGSGGDASAGGGANAAGAPASPEGGTSAEPAGTAGATAEVDGSPTIVSVLPEGDATGVEPATSIVITFSEPLAQLSVTPESIKLLDGDQAVAGKLSYTDGTVTFVPDAPLALLATYEISVTTTVTNQQGAALKETYSSKFRTRDGAWHTVDAVSAKLWEVARSVPITATGDVLVSWVGAGMNESGATYCPTSATWLNRGKVTVPAKALTDEKISDCRQPVAGSNPAGVGVVLWQEDAEYVQQFRSGKWSGKNRVSTEGYTGLFSVGVAPSGAVAFFQHGGGKTLVRRADARGVWVGAHDAVSSEPALSAASIAFDAQGNGLAVWRARDATSHEKILASRYAASSGKWSNALTLPGSTATATGPNHERGTPAVAFDVAGNAVVAWVSENDNEVMLMMSHFDRTGSGKWAEAVEVSDAMISMPIVEPPGLVFDGATFVAAWSGDAGDGFRIYSARFDAALSELAAPEVRVNTTANQPRMPRLGADAHQNLLLVWAKSLDEDASALASIRYDGEEKVWRAAKNVPGGSVSDELLAVAAPFPLSVNADGLGALMWGDREANQLNRVRLASFY